VPQFKDPVFFTVGELPWGLAAADASENGFPDVAVSDFECQVNLYRNTGNWDVPQQGFEERDILTFPGCCAVCLAELEFADMNNNGRLDLVVADTQTPAVWVFYADPNNPGHYPEPPTEFDISVRCNGLIVADLDNDGYNDVALAADWTQFVESDKVVTLWNDRENPGQLGDERVTDLGLGFSDAPVDLVVGHFTKTPGLARLDLVTGNCYDDSLSVLTNMGNREFSVETFERPGDCETPSWDHSTSITAGRFETGKIPPDVAIPQDRYDYAAVFHGGPAGSLSHDCSEEQTDTYPLGGDKPWGSDCGHLNGGTKLDLAFGMSLSDQVAVLLGKGDGTFQTPSPSSAYLYDVDNDPSTDRYPTALRIVDLNMDGFGDLVVVNYFWNDISVLINKMVVSIPPGP